MTLKIFPLVAALLFSPVQSAMAHGIPDKPIRLVLAYPAGGSSDPAARALAAGLSKKLGRSVFVENKPGGNTVIATQYVSNAKADGTTLYITYTTPYTMVPHMVNKLPYDPKNGMTPIAQIGELQYAFVVPAKSPIKSMQDLVSTAKSNPGKLSFPSPGAAQIMGLASELFKIDAGIDAMHVPYTGSGQAAAALLAGHHDFFLADLGSINQFAISGKVRILAIVGDKRIAAYPNTPTLKEEGLGNINIPSGWLGIVGPPDMNPQLVKTLNTAISEHMATPEMSKVMDAMGLKTITSTPQELAETIKNDDLVWGGLIRKVGVTVH